MMHKAWNSIEEVPYWFPRSYVKLQGHTALKIIEFDPNWAFPDCNSSLNSPMAMKWCKKVEVAEKRCPIVFQGHPSNFKVTCLKKLSIFTQIGRFRTVTPVWIHRWIWNDAQSLIWYRRHALLFIWVIHQISRSHGLKNRQFETNLSKITRPVAAIKSLRFALLRNGHLIRFVGCGVNGHSHTSIGCVVYICDLVPYTDIYNVALVLTYSMILCQIFVIKSFCV